MAVKWDHFDPAKHPRAPKGARNGGRFVKLLAGSRVGTTVANKNGRKIRVGAVRQGGRSRKRYSVDGGSVHRDPLAAASEAFELSPGAGAVGDFSGPKTHTGWLGRYRSWSHEQLLAEQEFLDHGDYDRTLERVRRSALKTALAEAQGLQVKKERPGAKKDGTSKPKDDSEYGKQLAVAQKRIAKIIASDKEDVTKLTRVLNADKSGFARDYDIEQILRAKIAETDEGKTFHAGIAMNGEPIVVWVSRDDPATVSAYVGSRMIFNDGYVGDLARVLSNMGGLYEETKVSTTMSSAGYKKIGEEVAFLVSHKLGAEKRRQWDRQDVFNRAKELRAKASGLEFGSPEHTAVEAEREKIVAQYDKMSAADRRAVPWSHIESELEKIGHRIEELDYKGGEASRAIKDLEEEKFLAQERRKETGDWGEYYVISEKMAALAAVEQKAYDEAKKLLGEERLLERIKSEQHAYRLRSVLQDLRPGFGTAKTKWARKSKDQERLFRTADEMLPKEWIDAINARNTQFGGKGLTLKITSQSGRAGSAHYSDYDRHIQMQRGSSAYSTALHEMGHAVEYAIPAVKEAEKRFYKERTDGEQLEPINAIEKRRGNKNAGYTSEEKAREDKFTSPYMGKDYHGQAYELLTMGLEGAFFRRHRLHADPTIRADLGKGDADYLNWIYGLLVAA